MQRLLATKLYPPSRPLQIIPRPRLIARLNELRPVTIFSAPPGFGKTSLIGEWRDVSDQKLAWFAVDEEDNNVPRFLAYFITAIQSVQPAIGGASMMLLQSATGPDWKPVLVPLLNELNQINEPVVLVLDDYHNITTEPIHNIISSILEHQPASFRIVIVTRTDPPLPLARLRGRGMVTEIRTDDLRFTAEEAAMFLKQVLDKKLSDEEIAIVSDHTEGWIAGLQMAALSIQSTSNFPEVISSIQGSHQFIREYLTEEVFNRQSESVQQFLVQTSILDRFCAPLCDEVAQTQKSQFVLEELLHANVFLVALDNEHKWYRYHHLFSEFLHEKFSDTNKLHRRAMQWFERNGFFTEAIKHAGSAGDHLTAARLVREHGPEMISHGDIATFLRWVRAIPNAVVAEDAGLSLYAAIANFIRGNDESAEKAFRDAKAAIELVTGDQADTLRAELAAVELMVTVEHGAKPEHIDQAKTLLEKIPKESYFLRSSLLFGLGDAYYATGDLPSAVNTFTEALHIADASENPLAGLAVRYEIAELYLEEGKLRKAESLHRTAIRSIEARAGANAPLPALGGAYVGLGKIQYQRDELIEARRSLEKGINLAKQPGGLGMARRGLVTLSFVAQAEGKKKEAMRLMQKAEELTRDSPRQDAMPRFMPEKVRFWLMQGNLPAAKRWAREKEKRVDLTVTEQIAIARVELATKDAQRLEQALGRLANLRSEVETQDQKGLLIEIWLLEALIHHAKRKPQDTLRALEECLIIGEPENYIRIFLDEGRPALELISMAVPEGIRPEYVSRLMDAFKKDHQLAQPLVEPLSARELEVLNLLNSGASNGEIAEKLVIAVGTVKRHTLKIYQKLGVKSRTQAITKARELNLL